MTTAKRKAPKRPPSPCPPSPCVALRAALDRAKAEADALRRQVTDVVADSVPLIDQLAAVVAREELLAAECVEKDRQIAGLRVDVELLLRTVTRLNAELERRDKADAGRFKAGMRA